MENLILKSNLLTRIQDTSIVRPLVNQIDWADRLIGILGARGTGKTTILLQHLKTIYGLGNETVYITMDDIYFSDHSLSDFAVQFRNRGGKILFIDEVHKYPNWAQELKNIYDFYKDLKIVFTGSSIVDISRQNADLSRRAVNYELNGLSYREFLLFKGISGMEALTLDDVLQHHETIAADLSSIFKPLQHFEDYLTYGYYPFFMDNINTYSIKVEKVVRQIIEEDLQFIVGFNPHHSRKIYQLMYILSTNVPFKPNISKLSEKTGVARNVLTEYLYYLDQSRLINTLSGAGRSTSILQKPDKIFLENTNLQYALAPGQVDRGSLRETFFMNQLRNSKRQVTLPLKGDFFVDGSYTFEVGGRGKTIKQVAGIDKSYVVADDLEVGIDHKIPLWLFGFLY